MFAGTIGLIRQVAMFVKQYIRESEGKQHTLLVNDVSPAEFSLVCRPLCGPGFGFSPLAKASRIFRVVSGVRSSFRIVEMA